MQQVVSADETKLVEALRAGDEDAFRELIRTYHSSLLRVARIYVPTQALAEEVVRETWLAVLEGLDRFEGRSSLKTWIFRILTNRAKTRAVRERRTLPLSAFEPERIQEPALERRPLPRLGRSALAGPLGRPSGRLAGGQAARRRDAGEAGRGDRGATAAASARSSACGTSRAGARRRSVTLSG